MKIREKKLVNGNVHLFLDIYYNGKRTREFLKLYLIPEKTPADKEQNRQTYNMAVSIRSKRQLELSRTEYDLPKPYADETPLLLFYRNMCEERHKTPDSDGNWGNWHSCLKYLEIYADETTTFKDIDKDWILGFKDFLNTVEKDTHKVTHKKDKSVFQGFSQNSKLSYFNKLRCCINKAFEDGIIQLNPMRGVEGFKQEEVERVYLTLEKIISLSLFLQRDLKDHLTHKMEPYCGKAGLNKLCHKARVIYLAEVVNLKKNYVRFAKDFINVHFHRDADDAHSKNLHNLNIGMIEDLLLNNRALTEYFFNQTDFSDKSIEHMIDMMNGMMAMPPSVLLADSHLENGFILDPQTPIPPVLNFECLFDNYKLELIARIANEVHIFTDIVTPHDMKDLFNCIPRKPQILMARDIKRMAFFFHTLHHFKHITYSWQKVISEHE